MQFAGSAAERQGAVDGDDDDTKPTGSNRCGAIRPAQVAVDDRENRRFGDGAVIFGDEAQKLACKVNEEHAGTEPLRCRVVLLTLEKLRPPAGRDGGGAMI